MTLSPAASAGPKLEGNELPVDFDDFYRSEFTGLVVLVVGVTGERHGAEDVVQDAMVDAHRRWDRVGGYESPRGWVRRVVVQKAIKVARKRANERRAMERIHRLGPVGSGGSDGLDPVLRTALLALPVQQRTAMALHYLEDMSVTDIADLLGVTDGTVKVHLSRGRLRMTDLLDNENGSPDA